jgi:hypothetical protein
MTNKIMKSALLQAAVLAVSTSGAYAVTPCPQKAFQGTWDGIVWTVERPGVNDYAGSCRLSVSGVKDYIGTVKGYCDTAKEPNVPLPVAGALSATKMCDVAFTIEFDNGPALSFNGTLSGASRDYISGTYINNETGSAGVFSLSKLK